MIFTCLVVASSIIGGLVLAAPTPESHVLHEKRHVPFGTRSDIAKRSRVDPSAVLPIKIGLSQSNLNKGYDYLVDVADPKSSNFGKHMTGDEVARLFAPSSETIETVKDWLVSAGIAISRISLSNTHGWLYFNATTEEAEALLSTEYHEYAEDGQYMVGCEEYWLPAHVQKHVDFIKPAVKPALLKKRELGNRKLSSKSPIVSVPLVGQQHKKYNLTDLEACEVMELFDPPRNITRPISLLTPYCINALYNIPAADLTKTPYPGNEFGLFEGLNDVWDQEDLNSNFANFTPFIPQGTHPITFNIDGADPPLKKPKAVTESVLDLAIAYPIVFPQTIYVYQTDDHHWAHQEEYATGPVGFLDTFLDAVDGSFCTYKAFGQKGDSPFDPVYPDERPGGYKGPRECGVYPLTKVLSISYGGDEFYEVSTPYLERQCNEWMKLGLQGHSVFVSSGDSGVGDPSDCLGDGDIFNPQSPPTCPYITAVGATQLKPNTSILAAHPEEAVDSYWNGFYSGGGFSNIFAIPSYQADAVATYFDISNPPYPYYETLKNKTVGPGLYNRIGRGYPDVSANGAYNSEYNGGSLIAEGGTSMSSPLFASIINRITEDRLNAGKGLLGFLNPTFYANPDVFNDITVGSNPGCGSAGFSTAKGWDPVTGLGTPHYSKLHTLLMSLP